MLKIKKLLAVIMTVMMILFSGVCAAAEDVIEVTFNGEKIFFDVQPQIINNRTMVPLRKIFEVLGADVVWNGGENTVIASRQGVVIEITVGAKYADVGNTAVELDSPAVIVNNRVLVPARFVSESMNCTVKWNEGERLVEITSEAPIPQNVLNALEEIDKRFGKELLDWLISMYDPETGGFYFSASARDNEGFAPDIESFVQALSIMQRLGLLKNENRVWQMPEWFREKSVKFLQERQNPDDGYFYDPQFKKFTNQAKKERNSSFAVSCLRSDLNSAPLYLTAEERLKEEKSIEEKQDSGKANSEDRYKSPEAFIAWLEDISSRQKNSYFWGSDISSARDMIEAAGYTDILVDWLVEKQNVQNGSWEKDFGETAVDGILKISGFFNKNTRPYPNYEKALVNIVKYAETFSPTSGSSLWNPIGAAKIIINSLDEIDPKVAMTVNSSIANVLIRSAQQCDKFRKDDGGYSYYLNNSSVYSNDVVVSMGLAEGDVNAVSLVSLVYYDAYDLAGIPRSDVWGEYSDYFWESLKNKEPVQKVPSNPVIYEENFEDVALGTLPKEFNVLSGSAEVTRYSKKRPNQYLAITSDKTAATNIQIKHPMANQNTITLSFKLMIESGNKTSQIFANWFGESVFEWLIRDNGDTYSINHRVFEGTGTVMIPNLDYDEWNNIKIEYQPGVSADDTKINYYYDDVLIGTSGDYYKANEGRSAPTTINTMFFKSFSGVEGTIYIDDIKITQSV